MRNAFNKEVLREIKNTFDRFLAILIIIALGVSFFAGIGSTGARMKSTQNNFLTEQNLMDIRVVSNYGLNDNDIKAISNIEGVKQVYATYNTDAITENKGVSLLLKVHAYDAGSGMNIPLLVSGRLPEKNNECVVENSLLYELGVSVGDTITLESGKDTSILNYLRTKRFTIVGVVSSPYYISYAERGSGSIGNGRIDCYIMIPQNNFYQDVYSEAFITVEGADTLMSFSSTYKDTVKIVEDRLKELELVRAKERAAEMTSKAYEEINKQQTALKNSRLAASADFDAAEAQTLNSRRQLERSAQELAVKRADLTRNLQSLKSTRDSISFGINEIDAAINTVYARKTELLSYNGEVAALLVSVDRALSELETQRQSLSLNLTECNSYIREAETGLRLIEQNEKQISDSLSKLNTVQAELDEARRLSNNELDEAEKALKKLRENLDDIGEPDWYILNRESVSGFLSYREDSDKIEAIGRAFPLFFFLVAALICLTTMTRLIEERRTEIGTLKALGYGELKILSKYIAYSTIPTLIGGIAGGYIGMVMFPDVIIGAYKSLYTIQPSPVYVDYTLWGIGVLLGILTTVTASVLTCINELRENPSSLLRSKPPKTGKKTVFEMIPFFWKKLSFTYKVTIRNIVRYKKRFFMTVFGIGGCTALLLAAFGLKNSISDLASKQFGEIFLYDMKVSFTDKAKQKDIIYTENYLSSNLIVNGSAIIREKNYDADGNSDDSESFTLIIPEDAAYFTKFVGLKERVSQKHLPLNSNSVILSEKLAKLLDVSVGDEITIRDGGDVMAIAVVTGICENYFNNFIYMHKNIYETLFNEDTEYNTIYNLIDPRASSNDSSALANAVLDIKNVGAVIFMDDVVGPFTNAIASLDLVVFVIVASAGVLAFVVLYNLTNININERIRELATIEVLGFNDKEVSDYVYRENILLTAAGILLGYLLGYFLHLYLINTAESRLMMFSREIWLSSYIYSMIMTSIFSFGVNLITSRKLKKINMVEALKSVE